MEFVDRIFDTVEEMYIHELTGLPLLLPIEYGFTVGSVQDVREGAASVTKPHACPGVAQAVFCESASQVSHFIMSHQHHFPLNIGVDGGCGGVNRSYVTSDTAAMFPDIGSSTMPSKLAATDLL